MNVFIINNYVCDKNNIGSNIQLNYQKGVEYGH